MASDFMSQLRKIVSAAAATPSTRSPRETAQASSTPAPRPSTGSYGSDGGYVTSEGRRLVPQAAQQQAQETREQDFAERRERPGGFGEPDVEANRLTHRKTREGLLSSNVLVEEMSQEDYDKLSPAQKDAVDYNTMLVEAVELDRQNRSQYENMSSSSRGAYDDLVGELFGEERGSDKVAPETVSLLKQLGLQDEHADLDDYLSLGAAISADDVDLLNTELNFSGEQFKAPAPQGNFWDAMQPAFKGVERAQQRTAAFNTPGLEDPERYSYALQRASAARDIGAALERGNALLANVSGSAFAVRGGLRQSIGALAAPEGSEPMTGFGDEEIDRIFEDVYRMLSEREDENFLAADTALKDINDLFTGETRDAFYAYADLRTRNTRRFADPDSEDRLGYRPPEEIRKLLGLGE